MAQKINVLGLTTTILLLTLLFFTGTASAAPIDNNVICIPANDTCKDSSIGEKYSCLLDDPKTNTFRCKYDEVKNSFGTINPPVPLQQFIGKDPTGAGGISRFLSNFVALFYGLAGIVLIFMLLWGAWDWMTSEGDKEKLDSARKKIINAIVGIILFAVAFAIIQVLGQFTGFKFFQGQK